MLNRKTYIGIAIIIIICLFLIGLVWWWYGEQLDKLDKKLPAMIQVQCKSILTA